MKNFSLGFLLCLCLILLVIQSYLIFCPHSARERDIHVINNMILPYDGFALRPFNNGPVFPHNQFPFSNMKKDQNESIDKDKAILPELME